MTFEEARVRYPWLEFDRDEYRVNLHCSGCDGLETFSALMLERDFNGDLAKVKSVRYHMICGRTKQDLGRMADLAGSPAKARAGVAVKTVREISFTDE